MLAAYPTMASLALHGVSRIYPGPVAALDRVSLSVRDEEFVVIVGPSGCGKSTTLRLIAGLEAANEGNIQIGERTVNNLAPKNRNVAMVFQNYALYPHMNVSRNMAFALELRSGGLLGKLRRRSAGEQPSLSKHEIRQRVEEVARTLGIEKLLDRKPGQLSGGEKQRVALGRAIVRRPDLFLFDEPLSNLDARLRVEMRQELKRLHRELRTTMIYVTHDQVEALTLGDRVVVMQGGQIQQIGKPLEVYDQPANRFVAGFIGSPTMNFLAGTLAGEPGDPQFQAQGVSLPVADLPFAHRAAEFLGQEITLGVRPEAVHVVAAGQQLPTTEAGRAQVLDLEPQGDATVVHLQLVGSESTRNQPASNHQTLTAKLPARTLLATGEAVRFGFDRVGCHLFDANGENLGRPAASLN